MFSRSFQWPSLLLFATVLAMGCASPKAPTGGAEDMEPPAIVAAESTPNFQTNFIPEEIIITFDEWFTLKDVAAQVVISPLMPEEPEFKQKGKSVVINVPDSLREATTYTINFGNAIADLNEGNILENFAFVFSTGDVLDSIKLSGKVTNALTLAPAEGIWVILYPVGKDSAVYTRRPEYVAKTNKEGKWSMSNIRSDSFNVVALKDDNLNFLYDQETEWIGWIEEPLNTLTSLSSLPDIYVFPKEKRTGIREVIHDVPGWIKIVVDAPSSRPMPQLLPPLENALTSWDGDTLHIWYPAETEYAGKAIVAIDTSTIRSAKGLSLVSTPLKIGAVSGRLHPQANARFKTMVPVAVIDTSRIELVSDSLGRVPFTLETDTLNQRLLSVRAAWRPVSRYTLTFLPGAIQDHWGRANDTIRQSFVVQAPDQYGDLTMNVEGLDSTRRYILLLKSGEQVEARFSIEQQSNTSLKQGALSPGKYGIEVIEDLNDNGLWDTGDYAARRPPERKMIFTIDNIRAAWEVETKITWQ